MSRRFQFAGGLAALVLGVLVVFPAHGQNRPPKNQPRQEQRQQRQEQRPGRDQQHANAPRNANRPPARESVVPNTNRPPERARNQQNLNRPLQNTQPRNFNNLNPQEKQRTLDNYRNYQKLPPGQKQQMQEAARNWNRLSPEQRNHIKNDIMPRWQQLPPQRQRAIQQRLGVLKNMPESARNQHLADPNFTRGMSEEDKATLRDLAHLHVGGAPEPPNE
jgi:Protein of unknown function (DUF3106)